MIRLPQLVRQKGKELRAARVELEKMGSEATDSALALKLGWTIDEVRKIGHSMPQVYSISEPRGNNDNEDSTTQDLDLPARSDGPEEKILRKELALVVQKCLEMIGSAMDRMILVSRVLNDVKLRELADSCSCSAESIRLRQQKAAGEMRQCLENNGWDSNSLDSSFLSQGK